MITTYTKQDVMKLKLDLEGCGYSVSDDPQEIIFVHEFLMDMVD